VKEFIDKKFKVTLIEAYILLIEVGDFEVFEVEDLLKIRNWINTEINSEKIFNLFQFGNGSSLSRELREYAASEEGAIRTVGTAIIVKNLAQQLLIDYYLKFNRPTYPTKAFFKKEKAIEWIKESMADLD